MLKYTGSWTRNMLDNVQQRHADEQPNNNNNNSHNKKRNKCGLTGGGWDSDGSTRRKQSTRRRHLPPPPPSVGNNTNNNAVRPPPPQSGHSTAANAKNANNNLLQRHSSHHHHQHYHHHHTPAYWHDCHWQQPTNVPLMSRSRTAVEFTDDNNGGDGTKMTPKMTTVTSRMPPPRSRSCQCSSGGTWENDNGNGNNRAEVMEQEREAADQKRRWWLEPSEYAALAMATTQMMAAAYAIEEEGEEGKGGRRKAYRQHSNLPPSSSEAPICGGNGTNQKSNISGNADGGGDDGILLAQRMSSSITYPPAAAYPSSSASSASSSMLLLHHHHHRRSAPPLPQSSGSGNCCCYTTPCCSSDSLLQQQQPAGTVLHLSNGINKGGGGGREGREESQVPDCHCHHQRQQNGHPPANRHQQRVPPPPHHQQQQQQQQSHLGLNAGGWPPPEELANALARLFPDVDKCPAERDIFALLLCLRAFHAITPSELLNKLLQHTMFVQHASAANFSRAAQRALFQNVFDFCAHWIRAVPYDFHGHPQRVDRLLSVLALSGAQKDAAAQRECDELLAELQTRLERLERYEQAIRCLEPQLVHQWDRQPQRWECPGGLLALERTPLTVAQQLMHIELERLSMVGADELIRMVSGARSLDQLGAQTPPGCVRHYVHWFNQLSQLSASEVLRHQHKRHRAKCADFLVEVARECLALGNFNSLAAIVAGLSSQPVARLRHTWARVVQKGRLEALQRQLDPSGNFAAYRATLKAAIWAAAAGDGTADGNCASSSSSLVIPFFGLFIKDLFLLFRQCRVPAADGHLNLEAFEEVGDMMLQLDHWKRAECRFTRVGPVLQHLLLAPLLPERGMFLLSYGYESPVNSADREQYRRFNNMQQREKAAAGKLPNGQQQQQHQMGGIVPMLVDGRQQNGNDDGINVVNKQKGNNNNNNNNNDWRQQKMTTSTTTASPTTAFGTWMEMAKAAFNGGTSDVVHQLIDATTTADVVSGGDGEGGGDCGGGGGD